MQATVCLFQLLRYSSYQWENYILTIRSQLNEQPYNYVGLFQSSHSLIIIFNYLCVTIKKCKHIVGNYYNEGRGPVKWKLYVVLIMRAKFEGNLSNGRTTLVIAVFLWISYLKLYARSSMIFFISPLYLLGEFLFYRAAPEWEGDRL